VGAERLFQQLAELLAVAMYHAGIHGLQGFDQALAGRGFQLLDGFFFQHLFNALATYLEVQAQWALDGDAPVAEGFDGEDLALRGFLEAAIESHQRVDLLLGEVLALAAEGFTHLGEVLAAIDQLHLALARGGLVVAQHPHIGGDAGVVEHVGRQGDDGFDQIVLQQVTANLRLARTGATGKQRRAVEDDADARATFARVTHLADQVQQEQQRAIGHTRQAGAEAAVKALFAVLVGDLLLNLLPLHAERRVTEHEVEAAVGQLVVGQGVAQLDAGDVLALDQHVRLADGVGLGVELLAMQRHGDLLADGLDVLVALGEEAAGAGSRVVDGDDAVGLELVVLPGDHQRGGQVHDIAWGEVLPGGFVGAFCELTDQLFEDDAHAEVADALGAQISRGKALHHLIQQVGGGELLHEVFKVEVLEDLAGVLAEGLHVAHQVGCGLGVGQRAQGQLGGIEELLPGSAQQQALTHQVRPAFLRIGLTDHRFPGRLQHTFHAAQQGERQDDAAVLRLLEVTAQQVGNRPEKGGGLGMVFRVHAAAP